MGAFRFKKERHASGKITPILQWKRQPAVGFHFVADPTSVEYNGRLYVYGTNDTQQLDSVGKDGKNTYQYIHSLVMLSTDDMVNWTYHGLIEVKVLSPWGIASWAPSIVSRVESDGKTYAGEPVHPRIRPLQGSFRPGCRDR